MPPGDRTSLHSASPERHSQPAAIPVTAVESRACLNAEQRPPTPPNELGATPGLQSQAMPRGVCLGRENATHLLTDLTAHFASRYAATRCGNSSSGSIPAASILSADATRYANATHTPCVRQGRVFLGQVPVVPVAGRFNGLAAT
jgi:hypothetical protein